MKKWNSRVRDCRRQIEFQIPLVVATLLCVRQPQLRYSSEALLLQTLQLLCELLYHLLLLLQLFLQLLL
jgi:hypothetical protein